jgi:hypothetical protein
MEDAIQQRSVAAVRRFADNISANGALAAEKIVG